MSRPFFDPRDWYWVVATNPTQVYASARSIYVAPADTQYQAFLADSNAPSQIDTEANLADVLAPYGLPFLTNKPTVNFTDEIAKALFLIAFNHENRIRTLNAQATVTAAQFLTAVRNLL